MGFWDKRGYLGQTYGEWLNIPIIYLLSGGGGELAAGSCLGGSCRGGIIQGLIILGAICGGQFAFGG